ncbi:Uncharacterized protein OBRU01_07340 [Operophtera brumata]|uniref:Uncharacterized protein n=1 Tax=Operophtera brumata TaxID=104452 RepID=A0A0L7LCY2_OPEBR|nr:Uncharacterized protein OBRU01_07340 [Operophtera brumata]
MRTELSEIKNSSSNMQKQIKNLEGDLEKLKFQPKHDQNPTQPDCAIPNRNMLPLSHEDTYFEFQERSEQQKNIIVAGISELDTKSWEKRRDHDQNEILNFIKSLYEECSTPTMIYYDWANIHPGNIARSKNAEIFEKTVRKPQRSNNGTMPIEKTDNVTHSLTCFYEDLPTYCSSSLKFFYANIRSICKSGKFDKLKCILKAIKSVTHIIILTETWLKSDSDARSFNLPNYTHILQLPTR